VKTQIPPGLQPVVFQFQPTEQNRRLLDTTGASAGGISVSTYRAKQETLRYHRGFSRWYFSFNLQSKTGDS